MGVGELGSSEVWTFAAWEFGGSGAWQFGSLDVRSLEVRNLRSFGSLEVWESGSSEVRKFESLNARLSFNTVDALGVWALKPPKR